jgi:2'-5' RNA ligase
MDPNRPVGAPPPAQADSARLFIALWPTAPMAAEMRARFDAVTADAAARPVALARLHLTLHFLGRVARARLPALQDALGVPFDPFELRFDRCERWPSGLVVMATESVPPALQDLHDALAGQLGAWGLRAKEGTFRPHVTLARGHGAPLAAAATGTPPLHWMVRHYVLAESLQDTHGSYRMLQTWPARNRNPPADPGDKATGARPDNALVAQALREMALLLDAQGDNPFRVGAYRRAADTVARLGQPLREIHASTGVAGLDALPGIGPRIAAAIVELLGTGHWQQLERLRGNADPVALFRTIPGVGPDLALRLHDELGVDTLEALESAARNGRLEGVAGIGTRRATAIRAALTDMLDRQRMLRAGAPRRVEGPEPPVDMVLDVDREYRAGVDAGRLPMIAPRRFNPEGKAWLPVLHTDRPGWHFTALFSNTARAHELDRLHDWVVVYGDDEAHHEHTCTVVTASRGVLAGRRAVRGREDACRAWYAQHASP